MAGNVKPESSRLNLFYILQILEHYSDENHPLSAAEITDKVNTEFGYLSVTNTVMSVDTVKRTLEELTDKIFQTGVDYEGLTHKYGYYIYCVMKKDDRYMPYCTEEGKLAPKKYYYQDCLKTCVGYSYPTTCSLIIPLQMGIILRLKWRQVLERLMCICVLS